MTQREHSRTGLLMTELILALLFFSITAACCLQVFAKASAMSREAKQLKEALNSAENLVQQLKEVKGDIARLKEFYPEMESGDRGIFYYNEQGASCKEQQASYWAAVETAEAKGVCNTEIICYDREGEEIYHLSTAFIPGD